MNKSKIVEFAKNLWNARETKQPCETLSDLAPEITIADAYKISEINFQKRIKPKGIKAVGKKIGLTSFAVQKQLGVAEPDFGYLSSDMSVPNQEKIPNTLIQGKAEGEVAFVLKKQLKGPNITAEDVIAATDFVLPCIEVVDSRVRDWKIKIQDTVADNASSAYFVLGDTPTNVKNIDLVNAKMQLTHNGSIGSEGLGKACLDSPLFAVAWLANCMARYDIALEAGDLILSGAYGPMVNVKAGDSCSVEIQGLGTVSCQF